MAQGNKGQIKAPRGSAIERLRASGQMTAEDEAHHVALFQRLWDRGNEKLRDLMEPAFKSALAHRDRAKG